MISGNVAIKSVNQKNGRTLFIKVQRQELQFNVLLGIPYLSGLIYHFFLRDEFLGIQK